MIKITERIEINEEELKYKAIYSSGPGGQHVNKIITAIQLRFHIIQCHTLPHDVQHRLIHLGGSRVNINYQLVITAKRHRSQERNRREALERLCMLIRKAAERTTPRIKRKRTYAENQPRLEQKKHCSERKAMRERVIVADQY